MASKPTAKSKSKPGASLASVPSKVLSMPVPKPAPEPTAKSNSKSKPAPSADLSKFGLLDDVAEDYRPLLVSLYEERRQAKLSEDVAIELRKALDEQIMSVLDDLGYTRIFMPDGYKIVQVGGRSAAQLSATMLVERGVDPDLIPACTVPGNSYTYIQVPEWSKDDARTIQILNTIRARRASAENKTNESA